MIQATAIAWALILTMYVFRHEYTRELIDLFDKWMQQARDDSTRDEIDDLKNASAEKFEKKVGPLRKVNLLALLTILTGIVALSFIDNAFVVGWTVSTILVVLTGVFSALAFVTLAIFIHRFLVSQTIVF